MKYYLRQKMVAVTSYHNMYNGTAFLSKRVKAFPITDNWIRPAPRASGLRRKRQCGVSFSYEERQQNIKMKRE
jgi:hypothetical protein